MNLILRFWDTQINVPPLGLHCEIIHLNVINSTCTDAKQEAPFQMQMSNNGSCQWKSDNRAPRPLSLSKRHGAWYPT